ncbi:2OG-Fe(II) oxygenase [Marinibactrum halimedae]|uniref:Prolyl 4-hydroxylase subunit alpha n=1 Tax=Marinibactrum halimedae TaxID=1444977 RepID=A0AA37T3S0_9GAMM|nr:2OG-Fe(II) oxygenase [Marinibactrum halimedae]MCD9461108.1 2OG-Fe(II) oxygenase [Marinibactrum halimedae]GLS24448.1 prolyl 4-hydroxylase subunit alpha [Marinibactrum halimedae]
MTDFVEIYDEALSPEFCKEIIAAFEDNKTFQVPGQTGGGVDTSKKLSKDIHLLECENFKGIVERVLEPTRRYVIDYMRKYHFLLIGAFGLTVRHPKTGEPIKLTNDNYQEVGEPQAHVLTQQLFRVGAINAQKYEAGKGGYPYWHSEIFPQMPHNEALHRALLFMFYLNDVEEGGETEFYYQDKTIVPKAGRMVIAPAGFTHTHRGNVPRSGDKYILTSWILFSRAEAIYGSGGAR